MKMPDDIIRREIEKNGVMSFARFMQLALYCPGSGYYETKKDIGKHGDFITSVSVGSLFGEMLAFQFAAWLEEIKNAHPELQTVQLIEVGAHDGKLACDILTWLKNHRPKLFPDIEYIIIESSQHRQRWQLETLKNFSNVKWSSWRESTKHKFSGIIFSNELFDAFPVQRFGWNAKDKKWFEWGVAFGDEKFIWSKIQNSQPPIQNPGLEAVLPDGYVIEISVAAENWWRDAANSLKHGKLLTIDYGFTSDEMFSPSRTDGTLRAYFKHCVTNDVLANIGEQDLTAHVDFSAFQKAGEENGLKTEFFGGQTKFLTEIFKKTLTNKLFGDWGKSRTRQFQTLTHPDHLGRAFRVLVQSR